MIIKNTKTLISSIFVTIFLAIPIASASTCGYDSCPKGKQGYLNVHLVPHTHDDVGWLKTVDQYYYGSNKYITTVGVQYILDTVVPELMMDPTKRFIYVEIAFFWRWWQEQEEFMKAQVRKLVSNGQLEFINGGWCMNDEASTHYNAIIDQMTWGFKRLNDTFGECARPRIAWQIDPFGHSKEQASLFAEMGMDGLFFGRLDYADKDKRLKDKTMEMMWEASSSLGKSSWLFTGALYNGYGPPDGFCFDSICGDDPIMDDPRMHDYNKDAKIRDFIKAVEDQAQHYATNNIIMTMGSDFQYTNARVWYKNLDKLIKYVNALQNNGSKIHTFYSTPSCYLKSLNEAGKIWTSKSDDFFPYASDPHAFWTGYFTSRPALKGMERQTNNFLQICKQLGVLNQNPDKGDITRLREVMGVLQHHDAVSGTAKQHVTFDYAQRLSEGIAECQKVVASAHENLMDKKKHDDANKPESEPKAQFCPLLNITQCEFTENSEKFVVNVYNPLARPMVKFVRLPITSPGYQVQDPQGKILQTQVVPVPKPVLLIPGRVSSATHELIFKAENIPALGFKSYFISKNAQVASEQVVIGDELPTSGRQTKTILGHDNDNFKLVFNNKNGKITNIIQNGQVNTMEQTFGYYKGHSGNNTKFEFRASGAYIFRPSDQSTTDFIQRPNVTVYRGPISMEIHQEFSPWISQVSRVYKGTQDIEFEWLIGPIPIGDSIGKEIVAKYDVKFDTKESFFTDSNGRQMLKRIRNYRPTWKLDVTEPVSANYFPVNSRIFVQDEKDQQATILTDRSQGGTSMKNGEIELMVHRRLLYDDAFGVGEPLNEIAFGQGLVVRGKHWFQYESQGFVQATHRHRFKAQEIYMDTQLTFIPTDKTFEEFQSEHNMEYSSLNQALPKNVHLLTLEEWTDKSRFLIRFEHLFEAQEDPQDYSKPVSVDLKSMFKVFNIEKVEEVILGANLEVEKLKRLDWNVGNRIPDVGESKNIRKETDITDIILNPFQIRSFIVDITPKD